MERRDLRLECAERHHRQAARSVARDSAPRTASRDHAGSSCEWWTRLSVGCLVCERASFARPFLLERYLVEFKQVPLGAARAATECQPACALTAVRSCRQDCVY